jgi:hypothetical protein
VNAKRVTHRYEKEQADFDVERPRSRKTRDLLSRKSRKIEREEGTVGGSGEGKCEALARPARFHGFVTFRVATRGLLTPFDCPSKQLRAPRKRSASRTHDASFFFFFLALLQATDGGCRCIAMRPRLREPRTDARITSSTREEYFLIAPKSILLLNK